MASQKPLVVGNWKMELSHKAAVEVAASLQKILREDKGSCEVVICPSFPSLPEIAALLARSTKITLGAQNVHWEEKGAWTGEVSVLQISAFARYSLVGHSERRQLTGETDEEVLHKAGLLLQHGLTPIICIGETAEEREAERTVEKITHQVQMIIQTMNRSALMKLVIAYEPIWAISGHAKTTVEVDPREVAGIALLIRKLVSNQFDQEAADRLRLLYGGSVRPENIASFMNEPGFDGVLVGGASTHPMQFAEIIRQVEAARSFP